MIIQFDNSGVDIQTINDIAWIVGENRDEFKILVLEGAFEYFKENSFFFDRMSETIDIYAYSTSNRKLNGLVKEYKYIKKLNIEELSNLYLTNKQWRLKSC